MKKESEVVVTDFCSDCPDYEMCWGAGDWRIIRHACPTRCRELEALAEVERLKVERDNWKAAYDREAIDRKDCLHDMHMERRYRQRDEAVRDEALVEVGRLNKEIERLREKLDDVVDYNVVDGPCPPRGRTKPPAKMKCPNALVGKNGSTHDSEHKCR